MGTLRFLVARSRPGRRPYARGAVTSLSSYAMMTSCTLSRAAGFGSNLLAAEEVDVIERER